MIRETKILMNRLHDILPVQCIVKIKPLTFIKLLSLCVQIANYIFRNRISNLSVTLNSLNTSTCKHMITYDARHEKADLKVFVVVIPKEGCTWMVAPILLPWPILLKSWCHTKTTTTKTLRSVFLWRASYLSGIRDMKLAGNTMAVATSLVHRAHLWTFFATPRIRSDILVLRGLRYICKVHNAGRWCTP